MKHETGCQQMIRGMVVTGLLLMASQASAEGFTALADVAGDISSALSGAGVAIFTVAIMWAGYKMAFQQARWNDVGTVVIGAALVGGAAALAGVLLGG